MGKFKTENCGSCTLDVSGLGIGYRQRKKELPVAGNINFSLDEGGLTAIVGVNGIGKSTLLRTLGRIQPPLSGTIQISGRPLETFRDRELASKVSVVLTGRIPTRNLSVIELVSLGRQPYTNWIGRISADDRDKIHMAIKTVGLESFQDKKCFELSDGQLQKVMIARAISQDTAIILLDEPTTHLDLHHKVQILKLLQELAHTQSKIIVFTTHEVDMAIQLCDTMLLLDNKLNPFGHPCELIREKRFETLFPTDLIHFDARAGSFKVHKSGPAG